MIDKLKQIPLRVYLASAFLLVLVIFIAAVVPALAFGLALTAVLAWSVYTIIDYLENR